MAEYLDDLAAQAASAPARTQYRFPESYPGGITPDTLFDKRTERIVKAQADKLVATGAFEQHERDDVANELRIILAEEMAAYDPSRDRYTFTATILARRGATMLRFRSTALRLYPRPLSLNVPAEDGCGDEIIDLIPDTKGVVPGSARALFNEGMAKLEKTLDQIDLEILQRRMDGESTRDIANAIGMGEFTVRYHIKTFIAPAARRCGLDECAGGMR